MSIFTKITTGFLAVLIGISASFAQAKPAAGNPYQAIDKIVLALPAADAGSVQNIGAYINQHFTNDADKTRAAFAWVTGNISYDIDNMFAINLYETKEDKLKKALAYKKGICEHFALLFTAICKEMNIEACTIDGFTKQNGFTDYIPHVWAAAAIDDKWYLFDPTWGSGY
ncbi:MAG: hypothetical protein J7539_13900, partial [Niabella sp.]|nr:hypothetical protein [Niabella sp.]